MKKICSVFVILIATIVAGKAQFFVEGSIGMYLDKSDYERYGITDNLTSSFSFSISPLLGYRLNDNIAAGIKTRFYRNTNNRFIADEDNPEVTIEVEHRTRDWELSAFIRNKLWRMEKLFILVESGIYIGNHFYEVKKGTKIIPNTDRFIVGIYALPLISYNLTDKFSIIAKCSFLSLDFHTFSDKISEIEVHKNKTFQFNFETVFLRSLSDVQIGLIYNF